jgi:hypothetical protein
VLWCLDPAVCSSLFGSGGGSFAPATVLVSAVLLRFAAHCFLGGGC